MTDFRAIAEALGETDGGNAAKHQCRTTVRALWRAQVISSRLGMSPWYVLPNMGLGKRGNRQTDVQRKYARYLRETAKLVALLCVAACGGDGFRGLGKRDASTRALTLSPQTVIEATSDSAGDFSTELPAGTWEVDVDVDRDPDWSRLDEADVDLILDAVTGRVQLTPQQAELCDLSGDGTCSAYDAALLARVVRGDHSAPPAVAARGWWRWWHPSAVTAEAGVPIELEITGGVMGDVAS